MNQERRFVLATWDGGGVVPPLLEVARKLLARGHSVRVIGDPTIETEALDAGCAFSPWTRAPHRSSRDRSADILRDYAATDRRKYLREEIGGYFYRPGAEWTADVLAVIDAHGADVVLTDSFIPWAVLAAELRGLPSAALWTTPYSLPTPGMTPAMASRLRVPGFLAGARDRLLRFMFEKAFDMFLGDINRVRALYALPPLAHTLDQVRRADRKLVLTARAFDHGGVGAPEDVAWVGPQLADPSWCAPWTSPWAKDDARPLVLVGLSSTFQDQTATLRRLVEVLASMPVRGLVTLGPTVRPDEVPARGDVVVVPSVPHASVLPHASLLVTHCGHGTALKGLAAGVPMLCLPMGRDQDDNAARIAGLGAGIVLSHKKADARALEVAIRTLLDSPRFGEAARRFSATIARREGEREVAELVEALARDRPGAPASPSTPGLRTPSGTPTTAAARP